MDVSYLSEFLNDLFKPSLIVAKLLFKLMKLRLKKFYIVNFLVMTVFGFSSIELGATNNRDSKRDLFQG